MIPRKWRNALAHARRMVRCAQLKVRNLREEEREQQSAQKENSGKSQKKEHEVKRRVAQKERQLKQKVSIENTQEVLRQKKKKNEIAQKQQRHRSQERGKIAEADFKYIKSQLEAGKGFGGGSSYCEDSGFTLDISDAAMSMAELEMMAQNQTEAEAEAEVEAEMSLTDGGTLAAATAGSRAGRYRSGNCIGHSASRCRRICGCVSVTKRRGTLPHEAGGVL